MLASAWVARLREAFVLASSMAWRFGTSSTCNHQLKLVQCRLAWQSCCTSSCFASLSANVACYQVHAGKNQFYDFVVIAGGYGADHISGGCFNTAVAIGIDVSGGKIPCGRRRGGSLFIILRGTKILQLQLGLWISFHEMISLFGQSIEALKLQLLLMRNRDFHFILILPLGTALELVWLTVSLSFLPNVYESMNTFTI